MELENQTAARFAYLLVFNEVFVYFWV